MAGNNPGEDISRLSVSRAAKSSTSRARRSPAACTIIARNYLSHARILAESYLRHQPDGHFYLLVVDKLPQGVEVGVDARVIEPDELALPYFYEMCFKYDVTELCTAVKPTLLRLLLNRYKEDEIVYLDPDILIMRPLDELGRALECASIVLTPHLLKPIPADGLKPSEQDILLSGVYNLGFIALKASGEAGEFLGWWEARLKDGCRVDHAKGLFVDQRWVDLVPGFFPSTFILRDETYNVAYWNLHSRTLERSGERFFVNGRPLAFFHFSGFNPASPQLLSKHQNRTQVVEGTALAELLQAYVDLQMRSGFPQTSEWQYGYSSFNDGTPINPLLRHLYLGLGEEARARFVNPFHVNGADSFLNWATGPQNETALSPFLKAIYSLRYDLAAAFPDVCGKDRQAFLNWARTQGPSEIGYDPGLVRTYPQSPIGAAGCEEAAGNNSQSEMGVELDRRAKAIDYRRVIEGVRAAVSATLPPDATVIVVSKGDDELLKLNGRRCWHFPQTEDGLYAGYYPADSDVAIAHMEALRAKGGEFLLFPNTAFWWLEHYGGFKQYLEAHHRVVVRQEDVCIIFALREHWDG